MYDHLDRLSHLGEQGPLGEKLQFLHGRVKEQHPYIERIAIALYDHPSDQLSTFIYSSEMSTPIPNYQTKLADCPSLLDALESNTPRVINDMEVFKYGKGRHTKIMAQTPYQASYTMPLFAEGIFLGFIFFNSTKKEVFKELVLTELDMIGHMISLLVFNELSKLQTLMATVKSAQSMTHSRDPETGGHLDRMSRYARLIAYEIAEEHQFSDDFIEHLFLFAPLHDLGKIGIPDEILLKPRKLSETEFEIMKSHTTKGFQIIEGLIQNYGLEGITHIDMLRNIVLFHHEAVNGNGYPKHLDAKEIPLEARIVAVADVFDALTSSRPYKQAWSNDEAFSKLHELSNIQLDAQCVQALEKNRQKIEEIQQQFQENSTG